MIQLHLAERLVLQPLGGHLLPLDRSVTLGGGRTVAV